MVVREIALVSKLLKISKFLGINFRGRRESPKTTKVFILENFLPYGSGHKIKWCVLIRKDYRAGIMSGPGVKERSRPTTGVTGTSRPPTVPHKSKTKKDDVDLKSKEEEYRFLATVSLTLILMNFRRLNEELESKAASLLREADTILVKIEFVLLTLITYSCTWHLGACLTSIRQ